MPFIFFWIVTEYAHRKTVKTKTKENATFNPMSWTI